MVTNRFYLGDKASSAGGARTRSLTNLYCHCLRQCHSLCGNNDIPVTLSASAIIVVLCALMSLLIASSELALTNIPPHHSSTICSDAVILIFPSARRCEHARPSAHSIFHCLRGSLPRLRRQCQTTYDNVTTTALHAAMTQYRIDLPDDKASM